MKSTAISFEDKLDKIKNLLRRQKFSTALFYLGILPTEEKEKIIEKLKLTRKKDIDSGHECSAIEMSNFLKLEFTEEEKRQLLRNKIENKNFEDSQKNAKNFFPELGEEEILKMLLNLSEENNIWPGIEYFSDKLKVEISTEVLEKNLKEVLSYGNLNEITEILKKLNRTLLPKEKIILFKNSRFWYLKDVLILENLCGKKVGNSWFIKEKKEAIDKGDYYLALTLSRILNQDLKNTDLEKMLDKILEAATYMSEETKKMLTDLERHFPKTLILEKKEKALRRDVESGNLREALIRSDDIGRKLTKEEFYELFFYRITFHASDNDDVVEKFKEAYPEEFEKTQVL